MVKKKLKKIYFKIVGPIKRKKFKYTDFTIISNNCFGGIVYRNNAIPYNTPTAGLFFMADDYIKFIYNMKDYLNEELIEIKKENSKHLNYLNQINYDAPIGKLGDIEIMFLHYSTFEEAKEKWLRRTKRINYDKIIYKFSEQNECNYEHLKKFSEFNASNKLCFTFNRYDDIDCIQFTEFESNPTLFNDSNEKILKKYFNIYDYINSIVIKPRVLMVVSDLAKCNGITSYAMNYFNNIDLNKVEIDFVVTSNNIDEIYKNDILNKNRSIYIVNYDSNTSIFKNVKTIKEFMKKNAYKYNIIHSNLINKGYFYLKYAKKYDIRVRILHSHNATLGDGNFIKRIINIIFKNLAIKNANAYFACSNLAGKFLFGKKKFTVINNAVNVNKFVYDETVRNIYRKELELEDKFVIGQVGRLDVQKNHLFFVNVINELVKTNKNIVWLIVGNGILENEIKTKVKQLNLENNVMFLGSRSDVNKLYSAMDIFVLPSLYEGLSLVAVEAQISGLPSILSDQITEETKILKSLEFVSLKKNKWVEAIKNINVNISRENTKNEVIKAGYDIQIEIRKLEDLYIDILKNNL